MSIGFPKPTKYVKYLLIANVAIFVLTIFDRRLAIRSIFALYGGEGLYTFVEFWRLITYQFLHADPSHLLFNMLGVYFFGPPLERYWGSNRFLMFYLFCGIVAGLAFVLLSTLIGVDNPIIGASGSVLGLLAACALLFPDMTIILLFFPVPIRFAALLIAGISALYILYNRNLSEACHLGGMVAGFLFVKARPLWQRFVYERTQLRRQTLLDQEAEDQKTVDQILEKVHEKGIQSLTWREKRTLQSITRRQKQRDDLRDKNW